MKIFIHFLILLFLLSGSRSADDSSPFAVVLGIAQDGGAPHAGCVKTCCSDRWSHSENELRVSCLGIVDPQTEEVWIIDATPDFPEQYHELTQNGKYKLKGIFLTHAHIGHYTGLIHLGREVMGTKEIPVYAMPRMKSFLETNGPWNQLVSLSQISLIPLTDNKIIKLNDRLSLTSFTVPHRDEYSETVGFKLKGENNKLIFIPDIDKWEKWGTNIIDIIHQNEFVLIDGTFFGQNEIPNRNMSEIPHPFIEESLSQFSNLSMKNKSKVFFIHLNHSNPVLDLKSEQRLKVINSGFNISFRGIKFTL
ncbi:MAG: pyrroloquinoline quinone biosynthesis protein PqqB [Candidatus Marinimicrobia bacterium]|nr:pyrroloquinoline quinone biosynthesis protein PqqB [Candidatus Neomarinimicrobiota bacterium]|tara:strand:- start:21303 stop:22223 length:921 start_codon:yes stop_codon:yes gene_type:complete